MSLGRPVLSEGVLERRKGETLFDGCLWVDPRSARVIDCSPALAWLLGRRRDDCRGTPVASLAFDPVRAYSDPAWQALIGGSLAGEARIVLAHADGHPVGVRASVSPLRAQGGEPNCLLVVRRERRSGPAVDSEGESLRALAFEVTVAERRERQRVARELHDELGQMLAVATLKLGELGQASPGRASRALVDQLHALLVEAASATRSATFELNCPVLHQLGLRAALESLGQRMRRLFGLRVHVSGDPEAAGLGPEVQQVVFRVVRELLNNVYKHAEVTEAWVETQRAGDWVNFSVRDEGRGFDDSAELPRFGPDGGFGLLSARAQVRAIGGWLQVDTALGRGVRAIVKVPSVPPEPSAHLPGGCRGWQ